MNALKKTIAFVMTAAMLLSVSAAAFASGEAAPGMAPPPPTSSLAQNTEDMKNFAAVSVLDGVIEVDESAMTEGVATKNSLSGVLARYDEIGDWDGSTAFGHYGAVISGSDEKEFVIGGKECIHEVDGRLYNSVFILGAEDKDVANALGGSETRDYKDAQEGAEGAGIYADVPNILMENVYISTDGYGRSALHLTADVQDTVIRNSTIIANGSNGEGSSAPGIVCMYASARPVLIESSANTYFYNCDVLGSDWGTFSLDGCYGANVYIVNSYSINSAGGYSMYALGFTDPNTCWFYGSYAASAQYGTILCSAGRTYTGAVSDATEDSLARLDGTAITDTTLKNGWSYIGGRTNAVTMQADMSGAEIVGVFDAKHTIFDSLAVLDRDGNPLIDTMDINDYKDDLGIGAAYYFLSYFHGSAFGIRSENVDLTLEDCLVFSGNGTAIQTVIGYDNMASGIKVPDGTEYYGSNVIVKDMDLTGDIRHEDYQRKMVLSLEDATLSGAVVSGTCAAWRQNVADHIDANWNGHDEELGLSKDAIFSALCADESYDTIWGVRMSVDASSAWTVTGDSSLYSLSVQKGATIEAPAGHELEIYVDCAMNGDDVFYDYTTGTQVSELSAGDYTGVVILVK